MDFEKLGAFYLGKQYDRARRQVLDRLLMYDARDLPTHAVVLGITGSGAGRERGISGETAPHRCQGRFHRPGLDSVLADALLRFPRDPPPRCFVSGIKAPV